MVLAMLLSLLGPHAFSKGKSQTLVRESTEATGTQAPIATNPGQATPARQPEANPAASTAAPATSPAPAAAPATTSAPTPEPKPPVAPFGQPPAK
jgi:hypothetical protein